jgi:selenide,water dikinase
MKHDPRLLVGAATGDDAGVYRLRRDSALVQTVDFFTPIVDDPFAYGQIAAANALSDVYAMGGRPLTAMNLLAVPVEKVSAETIAEILRGGAMKVREAGCALVGGHTIKNPEPVYGLSVTGLVHPRRVMTNANARPGDLLVLTKPLGTGIATTGIKRGLTSPKLEKRAVAVMRQLNTAGAEVAEKGFVRAATDITGFGLLGHLASMCRASGVGAEVEAGAVPALSPEVFDLIRSDCVPGGTRANLQACETCVTWDGAVPEAHRVLLADAQTSGGLLLCVRPKKLEAVRQVLKRHRTPAAAVVGKILRSRHAAITVRP